VHVYEIREYETSSVTKEHAGRVLFDMTAESD